MNKHEYGLFTTIAMIVGIVIGSGIYFKCDDILIYTKGNIFLGVLVFIIAAVAIIFGCLTFANLAAKNDEAGGLITYGEMCYGKTAACALGWFQTFLYFPTITAVISFFAAEYICMLFGIRATTEVMAIIALAILLFLYIVNIISAKAGGYFQNAATVLKLIPIIIIAVVGLYLGHPAAALKVSVRTASFSNGWIAAIVPIAFSYDGWISSTSICHEIRNSKKNLPRALIIAPICILLVYLLYFVGLSTYLGPDNIMSQGNTHLAVAAKDIFGSMGALIIMIFVIISILGTLNGLVMASIRQPYSLAIRGMLPKSEKIAKINSKVDMPISSGIIAFIFTMIWFVVHFVTLKTHIADFDISEISITLNYMLFALIYAKVLQYGIKKEIKGVFRGIVCPLLAMAGSAVILIGGIGSNMFWINTATCIVILLSAVVFWKRKEKSSQKI